jgi:hypothetical protein
MKAIPANERRRVGVLLWTPNSYDDSMQNDIVLSIECNRIHMSNASESMWGCRKPEIGRLSHLFVLFRLKTSNRLPPSRDQIKVKGKGKGKKASFQLESSTFPFHRVAILSEPTSSSSSRHGASLLGPVDRPSVR